MKIICLLFLLIAGCIPRYYNPAILNETEDSVKQFAISGKTTNADVLKRFDAPIYKYEYSDGRYSYQYQYCKENELSVFKNTQNNEATCKVVTFTFQNNNILEKCNFLQPNMLLRQRNNKYDNMKEQLGEVGKTAELSLDQFNSMAVGTSKARLINMYGIPSSALDDEEDEDLEFWMYRSTVGWDLNYYLDIKDNKLIKKYTIHYTTKLNEAEEEILKASKK